MRLLAIALMLALLPGKGEAQRNQGSRRATTLKDSSVARVLSEFRAGQGQQPWSREILKVLHASGQTEKADELADSLTAIVVRRYNNPSAGVAEENLSVQATIALAQAGRAPRRDEAYPGALDRLVRIYRETGSASPFPLLLMTVEYQRAAEFLKEIAAVNGIAGLYAIRSLCQGAFLPEVSAGGQAAARVAILEIFDRKIATYDNSVLTRELGDCVLRIRPVAGLTERY
jgi:hypothetical protein